MGMELPKALFFNKEYIKNYVLKGAGTGVPIELVKTVS